jgi:DNA polymerase III subunit gamma/tau
MRTKWLGGGGVWLVSYRALYRVWRPQTFSDLVGQEHVTQTLKNALAEGHFSHAYLFSGPRGTGKTSAAKIMAKAVNCTNGPAPEPCNECDACRKITEGSLLDVVEIDAASNRGVDEIRDLRDKVKYAPSEVRYKVYIVDEVHMLTAEAFNALLKTLEEPPGHVIFILATTEPHKLPSTIISRCQRFSFRRIGLSHIVARLEHIVQSQGIQAEKSALVSIARAAEGGMRDALSLMDQVLAFGGDQVNDAAVLAVTGSVSRQALVDMLESVSGGDAAGILDQVDQQLAEGMEPERLIQDLIHACRDLLLIRAAPELEEVQNRLAEDPSWQDLARQFSPEQLNSVLDTLIQAQQQMKWAAHPRVLLEMVLVRICREREASSEEPITGKTVDHDLVKQLQQQVRRLEKQVEELSRRRPVPAEQAAPSRPHASAEGSARGENGILHPPRKNVAGVPAQASELAAQSDPARLETVQQHWPELLAKVKERKITVHAWLIDGDPVAATEEGVLVAFKNTIHRETTEKEANKQLIQQVMEETWGSPNRLVTIMRADWEHLQTAAETSVAISGSGTRKTADAAPHSAETDPVQKAVELFGEELVEITD